MALSASTNSTVDLKQDQASTKITNYVNENAKHCDNEIRKTILDLFTSLQPCFNVLYANDEKIVFELNLNKKNSQSFLEKSKLSHNLSTKADVEKVIDTINQNVTCSDTSKPVIEDNSSEDKFIYKHVNRSCRRTVSESSDKNQPMRGILKYPRGWRRTVSESNCDDYDINDINSDISKSMESLSIDDEIDFESTERPKKSVHFNHFVSKAVFRQNSIVSRRKKKNRKRAEKRNQSMNKKMTKDEAKVNKVQDCPSNEEKSDQVDHELDNGDIQNRSRQDSGYDSEENNKESKKELSKRKKQSPDWEVESTAKVENSVDSN